MNVSCSNIFVVLKKKTDKFFIQQFRCVILGERVFRSPIFQLNKTKKGYSEGNLGALSRRLAADLRLLETELWR